MSDLDKTIADWREHGTPGRWVAYEFARSWYVTEWDDDSGAALLEVGRPTAARPSNAGLIAAAPAMADEIDRLNARIDELEGDGLHVRGDDGVIRSVDEHYDAQGDVEQDPCGAWLALQSLWLDRETKIARIAELEARVADLQTGQDNLIEALTPSGGTKADYMGEFSFTVHEDDPPADVPWTTIKEIMLHILTRAIKEKKRGWS